MAYPATIGDLLARAAQTSTINDGALADLGRRLLEAVILDPATPAPLKDAVTQLLNRSDHAQSPPDEVPPDGADD